METDLTKGWFVDMMIRGYIDEGEFIKTAFAPEFAVGLQEGLYNDGQLSAIAWSLGRFLGHVQYRYNSFGARAHQKKKAFDKARRETILTMEVPANIKTEKAKEDLAYKANPDLNTMEDEINRLETEVRLYEKMPDRIQELVQIVKKEIDRRIRYRGLK